MKKVITFGEIMLRLSPQGFLRFSQANDFDVIYAGVTCVGMGSKLISNEILSKRDFDGLQQKVANTIDLIAKIRE